MNVNEAIEVAGPGFKLEGITDDRNVVGFRVLTHDGREIAVFSGDDQKALVRPLVLGEDTSNP
jgi:hypothetical protein